MSEAEQATGFPYVEVVGELRASALSTGEIAQATGVTDRQVQRWAAGTSKPDGDSRARLLELRYVINELRDIYTPGGVEIWLHGRNKGLGARRPIDLLLAGDFETVLQCIHRLQQGSMG